MDVLNNLFKLEKYDETLIDHKSVIIALANDILTRESFYDLEKYLQDQEEIYIINLRGVYVGFISYYIIMSKPYISYGILPMYRKNHIASLILNEFSEDYLNNKPSDNVYLIINEKNNLSKGVASFAGFKKDESKLIYKKSR